VDLCKATEEVAGDVMALLTALEQSGTALGDPESHPVVTSPSRLRALRRTPPTKETPYATTPPMIRVLYGFVTDSAQLKAGSPSRRRQDGTWQSVVPAECRRSGETARHSERPEGLVDTQAAHPDIGDRTMAKGHIPVDTARVDETEISDGEYAGTSTSQSELRAELLTRPAACARYEESLADIRVHQANLAQVRRARAFAQAAIAELTGMNQSEVSKLERRSDMFISTLRKFIQATGGELHLVANYPEGSVELQLPWGLTSGEEDDSLPIDVRVSEPA